MRIGSFDEPETQKEASPPTQPETPKQQKLKKWKNWWYYYKWYVICGILLLGIIIHVAGDALGWWTKKPDFQVAYIGKTPLPSETVTALEKAFTNIASDFNEDGEIIVRINQYVDSSQTSDMETAYYEYASEITLIGDISNCDSYFFLMEDPDLFQREFQLLAASDGSCPDITDYSAKDKVFIWAECPLLSSQDLGTYSTTILDETVSGSNQELLSSFSVGRRCFFTDKTTLHADKCSDLWETIYQNALTISEN